MVNVSKIACDSLKPYTKNGCRLIAEKTFKVPKNSTRDSIPQLCKIIDFTKIETNFGRGNTTIVTYKNKYGDILKRVFNKKLDGDTEKVVRTYNRDEKVLFITSRKYKNEQNIHNTEEAIYPHTINGKKGITRMKLDMDLLPDGSRVEKQVYEELSPGIRGKFLETAATRLENGSVCNKTINASDDYILEGLKDDPYLYIRNYGKKDFTKSAALYAEEKQGTKGLPGELIDERLSENLGVYKNFTKNVHVDSSQGQKIDMVNTLNHEYRHKKQYSLITKLQKSLLNFLRKPEKKVLLSPSEKVLARKFWFAGMQYPEFFTKGRLYKNNFLEVDAREAGKMAEKEYRFWSDKLSEMFGIPKEMVHNKTLEDTVKDLLNKVAKLRKQYGLN
jgi:hypothetical protein